MPQQSATTSREYKLMLNAGRFENRKPACDEFWKLVSFIAGLQKDIAGDVDIKNQDKEETRDVRYYDTAALDLRRAGYILRERDEGPENREERFKTTLKFRHPDRQIAAASDVKPAVDFKPEDLKFEEDVVPEFRVMYSRSVSLERENRFDLDSVGAVEDLFPGLTKLGILDKVRFGQVKGFTAFEVARKVGKIKFSGNDEVKCALSFWYLWPEREGRPIVAEFSFDFEHTGGSAPIETVLGANGLFASLQKQSGWVDFSATTKTAYAYDAL